VRKNLESKHCESLAALAEAQLMLRHNSLVIDLASRLISVSPWNERGYELLMLALYRSGRQTEALEAFMRIRALLAAEHGIDPQPQLRRLHLRMLEGDPELSTR
jgi:DNA-binding SARP family transcriptional activator